MSLKFKSSSILCKELNSQYPTHIVWVVKSTIFTARHTVWLIDSTYILIKSLFNKNQCNLLKPDVDIIGFQFEAFSNIEERNSLFQQFLFSIVYVVASLLLWIADPNKHWE